VAGGDDTTRPRHQDLIACCFYEEKVGWFFKIYNRTLTPMYVVPQVLQFLKNGITHSIYVIFTRLSNFHISGQHTDITTYFMCVKYY
jgi:hypothetical protein